MQFTSACSNCNRRLLPGRTAGKSLCVNLASACRPSGPSGFVNAAGHGIGWLRMRRRCVCTNAGSPMLRRLLCGLPSRVHW